MKEIPSSASCLLSSSKICFHYLKKMNFFFFLNFYFGCVYAGKGVAKLWSVFFRGFCGCCLVNFPLKPSAWTSWQRRAGHFFLGSIVYFLQLWAIYISIHYGFGLCSLIIVRYWAFLRTQCKLLTRTNENMKIYALNTSAIFKPSKIMLSCLLVHFKRGLTIT